MMIAIRYRPLRPLLRTIVYLGCPENVLFEKQSLSFRALEDFPFCLFLKKRSLFFGKVRRKKSFKKREEIFI